MSGASGKVVVSKDYIGEELSSPPTRVVWSPLFENSPGRNNSHSFSGLRMRSSSFKDVNPFSDGELPPGWRTAEEQQRNLLSRNRLPPRHRHTGKTFSTSSDEERSQGRKAMKSISPELDGELAVKMEHQLQPMERISRDGYRGGKVSRRLSEGSHHGSKGAEYDISSRKSDSDLTGHRNRNFSLIRLEDDEGVQCRRNTAGNSSSWFEELVKGKRVMGTYQEDGSEESELKRTWLESTGSESWSRHRRSKIRILEESNDLNCRTKDGSACSIGGGGIGRGRLVRDKGLSTPDDVNVSENLVMQAHSQVGAVRLRGDELDFVQKCRNWSVADSYSPEGGKVASRKAAIVENGSCSDINCRNVAHDKPLEYDSLHGSPLDTVKGSKRTLVLLTSSYGGPRSVRESDSLTDRSSRESEVGSNVDAGSIISQGKSSLMARDPNHRIVLLDEVGVMGKAVNGHLEGKPLTRASLVDRRCNLSQESDSGRNCTMDKNAIVEREVKMRKGRYDSTTSMDYSTVSTDREKDQVSGASLKDLRRRRRSLRKKRSQSPAAAVACAASMIGDTVEAVRKVREDAAEMAFKLAELHAHDAKALRSAAAVMRHHVDCLHSEVHSFESSWAHKGTVEFPWYSFLREFLVAVSLVSGVVSVQACINSVRRALGSLKQTGSRNEKIVLAAVLLTVGARFGNGVRQGLGQVKSVRKARDKQLREHLKCIMERTSLLSTLAHCDPTTSAIETY